MCTVSWGGGCSRVGLRQGSPYESRGGESVRDMMNQRWSSVTESVEGVLGARQSWVWRAGADMVLQM